MSKDMSAEAPHVRYNLKLLIALVEEVQTEEVINASREHGAKGATVINHARGEGSVPHFTFFGLEADSHRDIILIVTEEHLATEIMESVSKKLKLDEKHGAGMIFQIDIEDALGFSHQEELIQKELKKRNITE